MSKKLGFLCSLNSSDGPEIIDILERSFGADNKYDLKGKPKYEDIVYYIDDMNRICAVNPVNTGGIDVYDLEAFKKKFKHNIGDVVSISQYSNRKFKIKKMDYINSEVWYHADSCDDEELKLIITDIDITEFNNQEETNSSINICIEPSEEIRKDSKTYMVLNDEFFYELVEMDGKQVLVKSERLEKQLPKTIEEAANILGLDLSDNKVTGYASDEISAFQTMMMCLTAFHKVLGFKPDFTDKTEKFVVTVDNNELFYDWTIDSQFLLVFPDEKTGKLFVERFKDLIIKCIRFI